MENIPPEALEDVAAYFKVLAEPTRLQLLNILRHGEKSVGELAQECGFAMANISKHLSILMAQGLIARESRGTSAYYRIDDESVYELCNLVCGNIARRFEKTVANKQVFLNQIRPAPTLKSGKKS